jgi:ribosomal protein S18 acetylase RimI-like enzyme
MQIRPAVHGDARAIADIHVRAWQEAYRGIVPEQYLASLSIEQHETTWAERIAASSSQLFVAVDSGQVLGWVAFGPSRDEGASTNAAELWAIYVSPSAWAIGIGKALCKHMLLLLARQGFTSVDLWVFPENERAGRFYKSLGFQIEPGSVKEFELGGVALNEVRYVRTIDA